MVPGDCHGPDGPRNDMNIERRPGWGAPFPLAATAVIFAAAAHIAAIAEQQHQNDDPPPVVVQASAQAVIIVAHKSYLRDFSLSIAAHTPCYDPRAFLCSRILPPKFYLSIDTGMVVC